MLFALLGVAGCGGSVSRSSDLEQYAALSGSFRNLTSDSLSVSTDSALLSHAMAASRPAEIRSRAKTLASVAGDMEARTGVLLQKVTRLARTERGDVLRRYFVVVASCLGAQTAEAANLRTTAVVLENDPYLIDSRAESRALSQDRAAAADAARAVRDAREASALMAGHPTAFGNAAPKPTTSS